MMYTVPAAAAARAAATSPRGQTMPESPVGPTITGVARRSPNSTVDWSRESANAVSLRSRVISSSAPPSQKSNTIRGRRCLASRRSAAML
jgi:hypothetical protein